MKFSASDIRTMVSLEHISTIYLTAALELPGASRDAYLTFLEMLRAKLGSQVSEADAIELLSHHMFMSRALDIVYGGHHWAKHWITQAMDHVLDELRKDLAKDVRDGGETRR